MPHRATLKEVAALAGVSYQTVSKVLNDQVQVSSETEKRIRSAAQSLDYRPNQVARGMRLQRTHLIGYSWEPAPPDQVNPILDRFMQSMVQVANSAGYHLLTFPHRTGQDGIDVYKELIDSNRVDGFVISSVEYNDPRIQFLLDKEFPFVAFGRSNPEIIFPYVDIDGGDGMRQVVIHLVEQGHQTIVALAWPEQSRVGQNRLNGYLAGCASFGLKVEPKNIIRCEGDYAGGKAATALLLDRPIGQRPTAIVAFNDFQAVGAMSAAQERGLHVGKDLSITGFDDIPMTQYLTPSLTSVRQPIWKVGQRVMEILLSILDERPTEENHVLLTPQLIVRGSSGAIN